MKPVNIRDLDPKRSGNPAHSRALFLHLKKHTDGKIGTAKNPVPIPHWLKIWRVRSDPKSRHYQLWIGSVDQSPDGTWWIHGITLSRALRDYENKTGVALPRSFPPTEVKGFWAKYKTLGVCHVIDPYHRSHVKRWKYVSKTERVCKVCGRREKIVEREVVRTVEDWELCQNP